MNEDENFNLKEEKVGSEIKGNAEHEASGEKHATGAHGETDEEAVHHSSGNHDTLP